VKRTFADRLQARTPINPTATGDHRRDDKFARKQANLEASEIGGELAVALYEKSQRNGYEFD
jgi:hypothetical protein